MTISRPLWVSQRGGTRLAVKLSFPTDADGNGVLTDDEVGANIVARVSLPKVAKVGDVITVTDGTTPADITLIQADLDAGYVESTFPWPAGDLFSGSAWITHTADPVPGEIGLMVAPAIASGSYDAGTGEIVLDLTDDSTGDPDYREVYRDTAPMDPLNLPTPHATNLPASQTQFREAVAEDGTTYYYRTANVAGSKRRVSGEVSVAANAASLAQPTSLTVVDDPAGNKLAWTSNSSGHDGTTIHRSTATMDPQALPAPIGTVAAGTTEYIDGDELADGTYYYRVQDYQGASVSAASDEQTITQAPDYSTAQVGDEIGGGIYAGVDTIGGTDYHLIAATEEGALYGVAWKDAQTDTPGANSTTDGLANTDAMVAAGITSHPGAQHCVDYAGGGFTDWYLPSQDEMILLYDVMYGAFPDFTTDLGRYRWSSTQVSTTEAWGIRPEDNARGGVPKTANLIWVRPMRRVAV